MLSRRSLLRGASVIGAAAATTGLLSAFESGQPIAAAAAKKSAAKPPAAKKPVKRSKAKAKQSSASTTVPLASGSCTLTPEITEGPFYLDLKNVRADVTEGRPGAPLELNLIVTNELVCTPIKDAAVDIWHTDALGNYSGVQGAGGTFMRGTQVTDANGQVTFKTIIPGWYSGRTVHIHVKVHAGTNQEHTGQLFFDDTFLDAVFTESPYNTRGKRDKRNASDGIYAGGGSATTVTPSKAAKGYVATISMSVQS
jgi:protocatechuate 3,4-dioxygenase beta subunit